MSEYVPRVIHAPPIRLAPAIGALALTPAFALAGVGPFVITPGLETADVQFAELMIDVAALTAARDFGGIEVNTVKLIDLSPAVNRDPGDVAEVDLSEDLFGDFGDAPIVNQNGVQTQVISAEIPTDFYGAIARRTVGIWVTLTDTDDAIFAIDAIWIRADVTTGSSVFPMIGDPLLHATLQNDGFGLGVADGDPLPGALPGSLAFTGSGFDEPISSKSFHIVPAPGPGAFLALGAMTTLSRRRSSRERGANS